MESQNNLCEFKMPLHYPQYTKKDYQDMPERMLDTLLAEYGLPVMGDLDQKRRYAMGAFLWPNVNTNNFIYKSPRYHSNVSSIETLLKKKTQ